MSEIAISAVPERAAVQLASGPSDYVSLLKPRVMSLVIFTALVGMTAAFAAAGDARTLDWRLAVVSLFAIALGAGASGALNMWWDSDIDAVMTRTAQRPIPLGRIDRASAGAFGLILSTFAVTLLWLASNVVAAALLAFTIFFYVVIYSMWLKRRT
ncbi:MAG: UbiA family prenyltransferase, partial [Parvularculaceae bacterium]|nr:UbiA family prenyltransferase [Parvularculaceae bacterium]